MASLFGLILRDTKLQNYEDKIDGLIKSIPNIPFDTPMEDTSGTVINDFLNKSTSDDEVSKLFENVAIPKDRTARYGVYEELFRAVPMVKRVLRVFVANILQKNPVTGKCYIIRENEKLDKTEDNKNDFEAAKKFTEQLIETFAIIPKLKDKILPTELLFGDSFLEVVDVEKESKKIDFGKMQSIQEAETASGIKSLPRQEKESHDLLLETEKATQQVNPSYSSMDILLGKAADLLVDVELSQDQATSSSPSSDTEGMFSKEEDEEKIKKKKKKKNEEITLDNILIKFHKPHNIVVLETNYGTRLGYLEVFKEDGMQYTNLTSTLSNLIGKITTVADRASGDQSSPEKIVDRLIYFVMKKVLSKTKSKEGADAKDVNKDAYDFIKKLFIQQGLQRKTAQFNKLRVRFIPPNRMVAFNFSSSEHSPYGESIIEPIILPSKLYVLSQLGNVITKLSRASLVRKWTIDTGATQMTTGLIQKLKRELYNTRVTLEDLSSFKSIPKILSD